MKLAATFGDCADNSGIVVPVDGIAVSISLVPRRGLGIGRVWPRRFIIPDRLWPRLRVSFSKSITAEASAIPGLPNASKGRGSLTVATSAFVK
jgi:hypothetical protein